MGERGWELITTDEPTLVTKTSLDAVVVEDGQGDGSLSNSASTDESDRSEVFRESNNPLN